MEATVEDNDLDTGINSSIENPATTSSSESRQPARKRRKAAVKIDDYFDRVTKPEGLFFKCKLLIGNNEPCTDEFKGPSTTSSV